MSFPSEPCKPIPEEVLSRTISFLLSMMSDVNHQTAMQIEQDIEELERYRTDIYPK